MTDPAKKERTTVEVFRERAHLSADLAAKLYDLEPSTRLMYIPLLLPPELEQLEILGKQHVWDGNVLSKGARDALVTYGLADRWNGMNFITKAGMAVLDALGKRLCP